MNARALYLLLGLVSLAQGATDVAGTPRPPPAKAPLIDHTRPLFLLPWFGRARDFEQYARMYPEELKPLTVFNTWGFAGEPAALRESIERSGARLTLSLGFKLLHQSALLTEAAQRLPYVLGVFGTERGEIFARREFRSHLDALRDTGGVVGWSHIGTFNPYFDDPDFHRLIRENRERLWFVAKCNGKPFERKMPDAAETTRLGTGREKFGMFIHDQEILTGAWLTGLISHWGYHPEEWIWYENGYSRLFEYSLPGQRSRIEPWDEAYHDVHSRGFPANLEGQGILNGAINGAAILALECPLFSGEHFSERFEEVHLPLWRELVARKLISSRESVMERTRAISAGSFKRLSATTATYLQHEGRFGIIPRIPAPTPPEEWAKLRHHEFLPGNYSYRHLPFLNALYPEEGRGRSFIARRGRHWIVWNPYETLNRETDFELPLYTHSCRKLVGRLGPYSFAIIEEKTDRIEVYVSNYWIQHDEFWDRRAEFRDSFIRRGIYAEFEQNRDRLRARRGAALRKTFLALEGHVGGQAPALEVQAHEGARHRDRWIPESQRYELDLEHNGIVRLTLKAKGNGPAPEPQGLSRNLAVDRAATASHALAGHDAGRAVDGLPGSSWAAPAGESRWLAVDLGSPKAISAYKVMGELPAGQVLPYRLEFADAANGPWRLLHESAVRGAFFEVFAVDLAAGQRWVRLVFPSWTEGATLAEWGLYSGSNAELKAWEPLVRPKAIGELLALLDRAYSETQHAAIEEAMLAFCEPETDRAARVESLVRYLDKARDPAAASVLRVLGRLGGPVALQAARTVAAQGTGEAREAARWQLAQWPGGEAIEDMLAVARAADDLSLRAEALKNLASRLDDASPLDRQTRERMLAEGLPLATETAVKVTYLDALRNLGSSMESLRAAAGLLIDPDSPQLAEPAMIACLEIASRAAAPADPAVRRVLQQVVARSSDPITLRRAAEMLGSPAFTPSAGAAPPSHDLHSQTRLPTDRPVP
jgi:hypothetical protein